MDDRVLCEEVSVIKYAKFLESVVGLNVGLYFQCRMDHKVHLASSCPHPDSRIGFKMRDYKLDILIRTHNYLLYWNEKAFFVVSLVNGIQFPRFYRVQ